MSNPNNCKLCKKPLKLNTDGTAKATIHMVTEDEETNYFPIYLCLDCGMEWSGFGPKKGRKR